MLGIQACSPARPAGQVIDGLQAQGAFGLQALHDEGLLWHRGRAGLYEQLSVAGLPRGAMERVQGQAYCRLLRHSSALEIVLQLRCSVQQVLQPATKTLQLSGSGKCRLPCTALSTFLGWAVGNIVK